MKNEIDSISHLRINTDINSLKNILPLKDQSGLEFSLPAESPLRRRKQQLYFNYPYVLGDVKSNDKILGKIMMFYLEPRYDEKRLLID